MGEDVNSDPTKRRPADYQKYEVEYQPYEWTGDGFMEGDLRLNVDELMGVNGERPEPSEDTMTIIREEDSWLELPDKPIADLNARAVEWTKQAFYSSPSSDSLESFEAGAMRILHRLARRMAPAASDAFRESLAQLMEPVRTAAVTVLIQGWSHQGTAEQLGCSVETVDFLVEVALSHLEGLVEFHKPRPRPRNTMLDSQWDELEGRNLPESGPDFEPST